MTNYIIATSKGWFEKSLKSKRFNELSIHYITKKEDLNLAYLDLIKPRYIFFPHWSWKVEKDIYSKYNCVAFHTAPLPYGRGGSPIQNLIIRGYKKSPVSALKMTGKLDAGDIYGQQEVRLDGNIDKIFARISRCIENLILDICENNPSPKEQFGEPYVFNRLREEDNKILESFSLELIYDRIRMVDGEEYPSAFIKFGGYNIYLKNAKLVDNEIIATVKIKKMM